jgi:tetratricopeptide (TPR) repeat protein
MNNNFTTTELLIQYLDGELDETQAVGIKDKIEHDEIVREELNNLRTAKDAVVAYGIKNRVGLIHKEMMDELKTDTPAKEGVVRSILLYSLRIAAILVLAAGSFFAYQYFSATPEKLFSENLATFNIHETRGGSPSALKDAYQENNMPAVIDQFKLLQQPEAEDYFLVGNAFLNTRQPLKAIDAFVAMQQKNKTGNTHFYEEDAEYYLAMSYLDAREVDKALPLLKKINADPNHPYHQQVSAWLLSKVQHLSNVNSNTMG